MSSSPPQKRQKLSPSNPPPTQSESDILPATQPPPLAPRTTLNTVPPPLPSPSNPRKRRASRSPALESSSPAAPTSDRANAPGSVPVSSLLSEGSAKKRGRTNTPWTAAEEQRLKQMRDAGSSWGEIAKAFPARTEGSVKKHWYKDMHYAEFAEDESAALRDAIREYEANKWKVIGAKVGKPAKACEQYAKEHFNFRSS